MPALSSITSGSITSKTYTARPSQAVFTTPGVTQWTVPPGVYSISAFMVSGGQGGGNGITVDGFSFSGYGGQGGSTVWVEKIPVAPGSTVTVTVGTAGIAGGVSNLPGGEGGESGVTAGSRTCLVTNAGVTSLFAGAIWSRGIGGTGGIAASGKPGGGGGGAGGYGTAADPNTSANGGAGGDTSSSFDGTDPTSGGGGASGGTRGSSSFLGNGFGGSGGGVGLLGRGTTAAKTTAALPGAGLGGSGGSGGNSVTRSPGLYGGGGSGGSGGSGSLGGVGAQGAVRIIWGSTRYYPTSNTVDY